MGSRIKEIIISVFSIAIKVVIIIISIMFISKYARIAYDYGYRIFSEEPMSSGEGRKVTVNVGTDMNVGDVGQMLEDKGLIRDAKLFVLQERFSEHHGQILPGEYALTTAMTAEEMIIIMSDGYVESEPDEEIEESPFAQDNDSMEMDDFEELDDFEEFSDEDVAAGEGYVAGSEGEE